jgi:hypothetical protein
MSGTYLGSQKPHNLTFTLIGRRSVPPPPDPGDTPRVGLFVLVVKWLQSLVLLELAQLGWIREPEERGREFHQPLRVNGRHLPHVFLGCLHQFMIYDPDGNNKF